MDLNEIQLPYRIEANRIYFIFVAIGGAIFVFISIFIIYICTVAYNKPYDIYYYFMIAVSIFSIIFFGLAPVVAIKAIMQKNLLILGENNFEIVDSMRKKSIIVNWADVAEFKEYKNKELTFIGFNFINKNQINYTKSLDKFFSGFDMTINSTILKIKNKDLLSLMNALRERCISTQEKK